MDCELKASPDKRRRIGFHLGICVHDRRVLLHRGQELAEAAGDAAPPTFGIGAIELRGEGKDSVGVRHRLRGEKVRLLVGCEAILELLKGDGQRIWASEPSKVVTSC